jgi:hypothetical integral membrane protein (TIGR02206 family)
MREFFAYESPYRTGRFIELTTMEYLTPFMVLAVLVVWLFWVRRTLVDDPIKQKWLQRIVGTVFLGLYLSHYILRFSLYGLDPILLPFQLCGISMAFAIYLLYTDNKTIHAFVLYTGVAGGLISLATPIIGYNSAYYRYYQFYGAHILLILTPLYFTIVKGYLPTKRQTIVSFWILQGLIVFMGLFNLRFGTDFMFVFLDPAKEAKFPLLTTFGGVPYYIVFGEMAVVAAFYLMYRGINSLARFTPQAMEYKNS